jgi:hypothetical protein
VSERRNRRELRRRNEDQAGIMMLPAPWVGPALTIITIWTAASRGFDYVHGTEQAESLAYLSVFGLAAWGWTFIGMSAVLAVGLVTSLRSGRIGLLLAAHSAALAVYAAFVIALAQGLVTSDAAGDAAAWTFLSLSVAEVAALTALVKARHPGVVGLLAGLAVLVAAGIIIALATGAAAAVPVSLRAVATACAGGALHFIRVSTTARSAAARGVRF